MAFGQILAAGEERALRLARLVILAGLVCLVCLGFDPSLLPAPSIAQGAQSERAPTPGAPVDSRLVDLLFEPRTFPGPGDSALTEAERKRLEEDAQRADEALVERWRHDVETATYLEVNGGWVRVDGHRLRLGPREGEVWLSFQELQFVRSERASKTR